MSMREEDLFSSHYVDFLKNRGTQKGYHFQEAPSGSAEPPTVTFLQKLRWWSWDRWKRLKKIRAERDRQLQDIIHLKRPSRQ
ncbi:MAG: hypothetical protein ACREIL_03200 [Nitrospiraceae bacterium]